MNHSQLTQIAYISMLMPLKSNKYKYKVYLNFKFCVLKVFSVYMFAQSRNRFHKHKIGILTLLDRLRIPSLYDSIPELSVCK